MQPWTPLVDSEYFPWSGYVPSWRVVFRTVGIDPGFLSSCGAGPPSGFATLVHTGFTHIITPSQQRCRCALSPLSFLNLFVSSLRPRVLQQPVVHILFLRFVPTRRWNGTSFPLINTVLLAMGHERRVPLIHPQRPLFRNFFSLAPTHAPRALAFIGLLVFVENDMSDLAQVLLVAHALPTSACNKKQRSTTRHASGTRISGRVRRDPTIAGTTTAAFRPTALSPGASSQRTMTLASQTGTRNTWGFEKAPSLSSAECRVHGFARPGERSSVQRLAPSGNPTGRTHEGQINDWTDAAGIGVVVWTKSLSVLPG
ncbi:hypothetical protein EDB92DRAFT_2100486 [Lactarius akahatsu]|uniref:Uncharacterized protein n=1 Tax=Lactarius akahatsu TaxID=416441 RepID=A0AAD4LS78_9AGAM|nr:hypothetical protein EDB92DRAFT_2100486 [Lactarius akahatsu]